MNSETNTDKVLTSILQCRLKAITEEMGYTLLRTSRSPILNEARDFVTGLYDASGRMLEQAEYIPVLAFALQPVCQKIVEYFGNDIHPGDVILHCVICLGSRERTSGRYRRCGSRRV
jgi:N-methylhydantoinase B